MKLIKIEKLDKDSFLVRVNKQTETSHIVVVTDAVLEQYSHGKLTKEQLIKKSFLFLLQKEDQASILKQFYLEEINNFFPEFSNIAKIGWIDVSG